MDNGQLIAGWQTKPLGEVCELLKRGVAPKYLEEGGISVVNQKCIRDHVVNYELARRHNLAAKPVNAERYIQTGDVLVNSTGTGTLGRVAQIRSLPPEPTTVDTHVTIVRPKGGLFFNDFFGYMLIKIENEITLSGEGASGQTELARTTLEQKFEVSFPESISEQKRIVAILDEAFAGISLAVANAEKNLTNARELFESYLNNVFTQEGEGWQKRNLGDLTVVQSGGTPLRSKSEYWDGGNIAWFSSGELNDMETNAPKRHITQEGINSSNAKTFPKGSLLVGMYDTAALKMSILDRDAAFNQAICGLKPDNELDLRFVLHAINAIKPEILSLRRGVRQKNLSLQKIKDIVISIPKLSEQKIVVDKLAIMEKEIFHLESCYQQKLTALNELKQSILQQAFSGQLTREHDNG